MHQQYLYIFKETSPLNPEDLLLPYTRPTPQSLWHLHGHWRVLSIRCLGRKRQIQYTSQCTETSDITFTS